MRMHDMSAEVIFAKIVEGLMGEAKLSDKDMQKLLVEMYKKFAGDFAPLTRAAPALSEPIAKDLTPIITALLDMVAHIGNSAELQKSHANVMQAYAALRRASFMAYKNAGFSPTQAFQMVLADRQSGFESMIVSRARSAISRG